MQAKLECLVCALKQVLLTAGKVTDDPEIHRKLLGRAMGRLADEDLARTPAAIASDLFHDVCQELDECDPFRREMDRYNSQALVLLPKLRGMIRGSGDPLHTAALIAVAGNLIDLGIIEEIDVEKAIAQVLREGLALNDLPAFLAALDQAGTLLYILDNAGEVVFDRLLVEEILRQFPQLSVTFAVKSGPAMNDALRRDAEAAGLGELGKIVETGSSDLGVPEGCSPEFWNFFHSADVVVAKGHANYETLDIRKDSVFFLLRAKCAVVAGDLKVGVHQSVFTRAARFGE